MTKVKTKDSFFNIILEDSAEEIMEEMSKAKNSNYGLSIKIIMYNQSIINEKLNRLLEKGE